MKNCGPQIKSTFTLWRKMWLHILNFILDILSPHFFQASCKKHDDGYMEGGDENRRIICDNKFFYYICRDIENLQVNKFKKIYYYFLASIFYIAVRNGGKAYFNYK